MNKIEIPEHYLQQKFFEHVGYAKQSSNGNLVGGCPFCREGDSWGKKSRFNYYSDKKLLMCFNCGVTHSPVNFLKEVESKSFRDVLLDVDSQSISGLNYEKNELLATYNEIEKSKLELPDDVINLSCPTQSKYYVNDYFIKTAISTIKSRRLDTALYKRNLYLSREDMIHRNRIIIPFYDENNELVFYQSRSQTQKQNEFGKYISSLDATKTFFGLDTINFNKPNLFLIEGPLDCFFVENSIAMGGLKMNEKQSKKLETLRGFFNIVWCLDNDFGNKDVLKKYSELIKKKESIFLWGSEYEGFKDFNSYCIEKELDFVDEEQILERTFKGGDSVREFKKLF